MAGYLKGGEWILICQQKASDAFSELRNTQKVTLLIILKGGKIDITTEMDQDFITTFVADTSPGIPGANLDRIFDPFFTTKQVGNGTGLGLSICYGIIKKMDPSLAVIMLTGHGSEESAREGIQLGAFDYLTKPCELEELVEKIREAARQRR